MNKKITTACALLGVLLFSCFAAAGPFTELPVEVQKMVKEAMDDGIITSDSLEAFLDDPSHGGNIMEFYMPEGITSQEILARFPEKEDRDKLSFYKVKEYTVAVGGANQGFSVRYESFTDEDLIREIQNPGKGGYYFTVDFVKTSGTAIGLQLATVHEAIVAFQEIGKLEKTRFIKKWVPSYDPFRAKKVYILGQQSTQPLVERMTNRKFALQLGENHPRSFRTLRLNEPYYTLTVERERMKKLTLAELDRLARAEPWQIRLWLLRRCLNKHGHPKPGTECKRFEEDKSVSDWNFDKCTLSHPVEYCSAIYEVQQTGTLGALAAYLEPKKPRKCANEKPSKEQLRELQKRLELGKISVGQIRAFSKEADEWDPCVEDDGGNKKASADETPPTLIFQPIVTFNAFGIDQPTGQKSPSEPYVERTSHGIHLHPTLLYPLYWNQTYSNMAYYVGLTAGASIGFTSYTLEWVEPVMENDRHVRDDTTTLDSFNTMDYGGSLGLVAALAGRHELEIGSYGGWVDWGMLGVNYTERRSARSFHFLFGSVLFQIGLGYSITKGAFAEHERNGASFMAFLMPLLVPIL